MAEPDGWQYPSECLKSSKVALDGAWKTGGTEIDREEGQGNSTAQHRHWVILYPVYQDMERKQLDGIGEAFNRRRVTRLETESGVKLWKFLKN